MAARVPVTIPPALRELCAGGRVELEGDDVRSLLASLAARHPQLHVKLCDERGDPRPHINVFVNATHIRALAGLDTRLHEGDSIVILPAVSGG